MLPKLNLKISQASIRLSNDWPMVGEEMGRRLKRAGKGEEQQIDEEKGVFSDLPMVNAVAEDQPDKENSHVSLEGLKEQEDLLLDAQKQSLGSLGEVQVQFSRFAEERGRFLAAMEKDFSSLQDKGQEEMVLKLFLIESSGSKFTDGLVFTVMAEDHVWAENMVRQWLDSNGRETDKIDKVQAVVSRDVRAIVGLGSKLLDR
jgi:hypothetical protein